MTTRKLISAAAILGRKGGSIRSEAKAAAVRANGRLGGRPGAWYRYDAGDDLGVVWVRGGRTSRVYDDRGVLLDVALPAGWRDRAEAATTIPAALAAIR